MMACPKCSGETRVVDSRPHRDDARVIQRRRSCDACGHRFNTQEGTVDIVGTRQAGRERAARYRTIRSPEQHDRLKADWRLRKAAGLEARETGRPIAEILHAWGAPQASHGGPKC